MSEAKSKHPFIDGYYSYTMIVGIVVGSFCLYAHDFWQGGAIIAGALALFFLGRWMDAKLKRVQSAEANSPREAMKDEEDD
jgi:hypothetical protein